MLAPDDRALLVDALRPPVGNTLDRAIATTFSLDLLTTLTVPLAFVGFGLGTEPDPIELMESVRETADRLDVFCQAGAIVAARWPSEIVALLEPVIHQVPRPRPGHLFHPKLWALRYRDDLGAPSYRVLVLSRNLTADRSWDVLLRLEGQASRRIRQENDELVRLIRALPDLVGAPLQPARADAIRGLADEFRRVELVPPEDASGIRFWAFGLPGRRRHDLDELFRGHRHLVISPFLSSGGLDAVVRPGPSGTDATIISRPESLDALGEKTLADADLFVVSPVAELSLDEDDLESTSPTMSLLTGLHAKVTVVEAARRVYVYVGSANSTDAAYGGNVELLCELAGGPSKLGVQAFLGDDAKFRTLLEPHVPPELPIFDPVAEEALRLDRLLFDIAQTPFSVLAEEADQLWTVVVRSDGALPSPSPAVDLWIAFYDRPLDWQALTPGAPVELDFGRRQGAELTPFLHVTAESKAPGEQVTRTAVIAASLVGGPADRLDEIIVRQIDTPEKFIRLLLLLLSLVGSPSPALPGESADAEWMWGRANVGLLEVMVRAVAANPGAVDRLAGIVERLRTHDLAATVLPADWDVVWNAIAGARRTASRRSTRGDGR
jgi:hypothetical protein